jgi:hypothetical protein
VTNATLFDVFGSEGKEIREGEERPLAMSSWREGSDRVMMGGFGAPSFVSKKTMALSSYSY